MATLRQLTTRFAFETDRRGVTQFQETLKGMRNALIAVGGAFAGAKIGSDLIAAATDMGLLAEQARQFTDEVLRLDSGEIQIVGELGAAFERVKAAIPGTETTRDFLQAFIDFKQAFPEGSLKQFETMFIAAGLISKINGDPLIDVFRELHSAAQSGDFAALTDMLASFGLSDAALASFIQKLKEVDPTGVLTTQQRLEAITKILAEAIPQLTKTAELIEKTTIAGKWGTLKANIQETTDLMGVKLAPAVRAVLDATNGLFDAWREGGGPMEQAVEFIKTSLVGLASAIKDPEDIWANLKIGFFKVADDIKVGFRVLLRTMGLADLADDVRVGTAILLDKIGIDDKLTTDPIEITPEQFDEGISDVLDVESGIKKTADLVRSGAKKLLGFFGIDLGEIADDVRVGTNILLDRFGVDPGEVVEGARSLGEDAATFLGTLRPPVPVGFEPREQVTRTGSLTISPIFNITGDNPAEITRSVVEAFQKLLEDAGLGFHQLEGLPQ